MNIKKVTIIGSGNVAKHLGSALAENKYKIIQVWGRNRKNANQLARKLKSKAVFDLKKLDLSADLFVVCVKDDAVLDILKRIDPLVKNKLLVHTSGSVPLFKSKSNHTGVIYPLQSFTKDRKVDMEDVPMLIEPDNKKTGLFLFRIASALSNHVEMVSSKKRLTIHLAAVFVNNFTNAMYVAAEKLLKQNKMDFDLLVPLIHETNDRLGLISPKKLQTGPAKRGDVLVIKKHLSLLNNMPDLKRAYSLITNLIIKQQHGA